ncbi:MAG: serpin family protein [Fibrobacter sp.]|nr:serpin family protein [Fibrobacter sp.]
MNSRVFTNLTCFSVVAISFLLLSFTNCANQEQQTRASSSNLENNTAAFVYNVIPDNPLSSISSEYSVAINTFSVNLLQKVYSGPDFSDSNVVLSPFSISRNLAVITEGATGESKTELLEALGGQAALDDAKDALSELLYTDKTVVLQCADAVWIDSAYSFTDTFRKTINCKYGVEIAGTNFSNPEKAAGKINNWISANTDQHIKNAVDPRELSAGTVSVLINAIYFAADWASPFDITETRPENFHSPEGTITVNMMKSDYRHEIRTTEDYTNARLYYGKDNRDFFFLDIYMPETETIKNFLTNRCLTALSETEPADFGTIRIPKFSFTSRIKLIPVLKQLGINGIFDSDNHDLSEIALYSGTEEKVPLYITNFNHIAGIKTDEEGTEAYAATVSISGVGASAPPEDNITFDRPFVYFIRAGQNGLVLFAGVVNNPS